MSLPMDFKSLDLLMRTFQIQVPRGDQRGGHRILNVNDVSESHKLKEGNYFALRVGLL